ncbi:putative aquaporin NIP-type [Apostasia shenzhenica]|uniref:Putative aquaporin NIP-type n=1 Tax=Apostasia shenzhenica TaxID=1088818 RepID=A0A2I0AC60_9ASPA|nr:putative aquaporin NIP-type [Apostasia shenzhenica]
MTNTQSSTPSNSNEKFTCLSSFFPSSPMVVTVFIGTFSVMFVGMGSLIIKEEGEFSLIGVALTWGAVVAANIYAVGHICGAHINPAVTFSLAVVRQFPWKHVPLYILAELLGSLMASTMLQWLFDGKDLHILLTLPVGPNPASDLKVITIEAVFTFIYVFTSCGSRSDPRAHKNLGGVAVGASVFFAAIVAGNVTGASLNPARSLGPAIVIGNFNKIWIYILSSTIGSLGATMLYFLHLMPKNFDEQNDLKTEISDVYTRYNSTNPFFSTDKQHSKNSIYLEDISIEMV